MQQTGRRLTVSDGAQLMTTVKECTLNFIYLFIYLLLRQLAATYKLQ